jgi:acid stress-induced BolA-like protein IbaG/YrbA
MPINFEKRNHFFICHIKADFLHYFLFKIISQNIFWMKKIKLEKKVGAGLNCIITRKRIHQSDIDQSEYHLSDANKV